MEIKLPSAQYAAFQKATSDHTGLLEAFEAHRGGYKASYLVTGPYVAWKMSFQLLVNGAFSRYGRRRLDVPRATTTAVQRIARELNAIDRHPALRGMAVLGYQAVAFALWRQERDHFDRIYSPMPNGGQFVVLKPVWSVENGKQITTWSPEGVAPEGDRLMVEETHLAVMRPRTGCDP